MDIHSLLRSLSEASGVSGYEQDIRDIAAKAFGRHSDSVSTDALGNLIAVRRGACPEGTGAGGRARHTIMLAAHTDEIGLMVTALKQGFLRFTTVGGVDLRTIVGQEVTVHGRRDLPGIVATRPPHVIPREERGKPIPLAELFIDVGLAEDELTTLVRVGDLITMRREMIELAGGYVSGKALDDRVGVASLAVCLDALSTMRHSWDVVAVATSQEEVGLRGAAVSAYGLAPQIAVAVDATFGSQLGVSGEESIKMDGGPSIAKGPNMHPILFNRLVATAKDHELKHQLEFLPGRSGTDAWAIQVAREGIPTGLLSIPVRYMHTSVETVCIKDIERTGRLLATFIAGLDDDSAAQLGLGPEGEATCC